MNADKKIQTLLMVVLTLLAGGCKFSGHTGPAPIVVDHGDHVEVVR